MYDVMTLGSATVDAFATTRSQLIKIYDKTGVHDLLAFPAGSKLLIDKLVYRIGGGGTNTATTFRRLGLRTAYIGKVGDGHNGRRVIDYLGKEGVDTRFVRRCTNSTGFSIILDEERERDRAILANKGANDDFTTKDIRLKDIDTKWIYSSSLTGKAHDALVKICRYARRQGISVAFNPSSYMCEKGDTYLSPILKNITVLAFNREEAQLLTGKDTLNDMVRDLHLRGPSIIVITDGKEGAHASDGKNIYSIKALRVKVTDTTGAGDAFASTFVAALARQRSMHDCLRMAMINATNVVRYFGAKEGLLKRQDIEKELKRRSMKVTEEAI